MTATDVGRPLAHMADGELAFAAYWGLRVTPKGPGDSTRTALLTTRLTSEIAHEVAARGWSAAEIERRADEHLWLVLNAPTLGPAC